MLVVSQGIPRFARRIEQIQDLQRLGDGMNQLVRDLLADLLDRDG
jgi:hypothetical protein